MMTPCRWKQCGGWMRELAYSYRDQVYITWICSKCGRSDNLEYEEKVSKAQNHTHQNIQHYQTSGMNLREMGR